MGNPKMQQVCAVTQLPSEVGQQMTQDGERQRTQVVAGDALSRLMRLGLAKRGKMGLVLFPMG